MQPNTDRAMAIIELWIGYANRQRLPCQGQFWTARDILEGRLAVPARIREECIEAIKACKPSADRDVLVAALEAA